MKPSVQSLAELHVIVLICTFTGFLLNAELKLEQQNSKNNVIASAFLILLGIYLACGFVFAVPFVLFGVKKIDPHATRGSWGFRLLIIPGTMSLWPLLLRRWLKGIKEPPGVYNAHRHEIQKGTAP